MSEYFSVSIAIRIYLLNHVHATCMFVYIIIAFGGLGVACWPSVPKFAGSNPAEVVGFLGKKNPQHAFLQRESKAIGPMS